MEKSPDASGMGVAEPWTIDGATVCSITDHAPPTTIGFASPGGSGMVELAVDELDTTGDVVSDENEGENTQTGLNMAALLVNPSK